MQVQQGDALVLASTQAQEVSARLLSEIYGKALAWLEARRHVPTATYRLQFNRFFTFRDARKLADYLQRLGVSDIYASPYFKARADSLHGYDIASHNELNPSIGTETDYRSFVEELHRLGLKQILDMVPNHMGIGEESNAWWNDVLENGSSSIYAPYFDIDWEPLNTKLTHKVLLPVLGDQYGSVLEKGELQVDFISEEGLFVLRYWEKTFPLNPRSYEEILTIDKEALLAELGAESETATEYQSILTAIGHLPWHWETDRERTLERNREKEVIKRRLATLCVQESRVCESIDRALAVLNGEKGQPGSFDRLDGLLEQQPYRLSFWRVATEEINYRRFFDVNDLAAIRVDQPYVFEETHRLVLRLLRDGAVDGLRIDHVDGLRDPLGYMQSVQRAYFLETCRAILDESGEGLEPEARAEVERALLARFEVERAAGRELLRKPLFLLVEKILGRGEELPADWPIDGTTGYEYVNAVNGLFVDGANERAMDDIYSGFIGDDLIFADLAYSSKQKIMRLSLSSEVNMLTNMLNRISERDRRYRDFTINGLRHAIREVIACFPVYRTYITPDQTKPEGRDRSIVETAVSGAKRRNPATDPSGFDFLLDILLLRGSEGLSDEASQARWDFVMKFQQVTGPVIAKGLEDTAFYTYNRLVSLNEVGGEPDVFGITPAQFHEAQMARLAKWPHSMLATSTHDTKRSEDVRARINVLSEMPKAWRAAVRRWARLNRKHKSRIDGRPAPDANEESLLYQTLLGMWPFGVLGTSEVVERVQQYMRKALNEAKVHTSWIHTNEEYLEAVSAFVARILRTGEDNQFLLDFVPFQRRVARLGAFNSLSQLLLKLTSPGVPDIYQGTELWDFSLVDPDNRRPVDYASRRKLLTQVDRVQDARGAARLLESLEDGRIKLFLMSRTLRFRGEHRALFDDGEYRPVEPAGKRSECVIAFSRRSADNADKSVLVVVPRLITRLQSERPGEPANPVGEVWKGTEVLLPEEGSAGAEVRFRNVYTGEVIEARTSEGRSRLALDEVFATLPFALLEAI